MSNKFLFIFFGVFLQETAGPAGNLGPLFYYHHHDDKHSGFQSNNSRNKHSRFLCKVC
jgi:hypothetical protein